MMPAAAVASVSCNGNILHLRRIWPHKLNRSDAGGDPAAMLILLDTLTKFGRNNEKCDVVLTSSGASSNALNMISREHAEITGVVDSTGSIRRYIVEDRSLNGTYINDIRVSGKTEINAGDFIKFGHMNGAAVKPGHTAPQANSEFSFIVEAANGALVYPGFHEGRRTRPLMVNGDSPYCIEMPSRVYESHGVKDKRTVGLAPVASQALSGLNLPLNAAGMTLSSQNNMTTIGGASTDLSSSTVPVTTPAANLLFSNFTNYNQLSFPYSGFNLGPQYLTNIQHHPAWLQMQALTQQAQAQAQAQSSGFRVPEVFSGNSALSSVPATTSSLFPLQRIMTQPLMNSMSSLLNPSSSIAVTQQSMSQQQATVPMTSATVSSHSTSATSLLTSTAPSIVPNPHVAERKVEVASLPQTVSQPTRPSVSVTTVCEPVPPVAPVVEKKPPVASPPMECDSSVPSPPKTASAVKATATPLTPEKPKIKDGESERSSICSSPPPPRAPAPAPWDSSPSPRPRDTPDRDSSARDKDSKKKELPSSVMRQRKSNEIARLLNDLTEGSWANQVRRPSISSRRPTDEVLVEKKAKKEKKKKEKKERERAAIMASQMPGTSAGGGRPQQKRRMRQLSDESSSTSDSSDDDNPSPPPRAAAVNVSVVSPKAKEKERDKEKEREQREKERERERERELREKEREKAEAKLQKRKPSYSRAADSDSPESDDEVVQKKKKKQKKETKSKDDKKKAAKEDTKKKVVISEPEEEEEVTMHNPEEPCAMMTKCKRPQSDSVSWVQCEACEKWYHCLCYLGTAEEPPEEEKFFCKCVKRTSNRRRSVTTESDSEDERHRKKHKKKHRS